MRNLVKLELKRVFLKSHFIGLLAANIVIALLSAFTSSLLNAGSRGAVTGLPPAQLDTLTLATMLVRAIRKLMERGALKGRSDPDPNSLEDNVLDVSEDYCRVMTTLDLMGVLGG